MNDNIPNHRVIRKYIVAFGNIFNDITIQRLNTDDTENQRFNVPIIYAPKENYVARIIDDPDLNRKISTVLPRMSYEMMGMHYASDRKLQTTVKNTSPTTNPLKGNYVYNPVPYDFDFELYCYTRNFEDGNQLIERILPFFTPDHTINMNLIPEMNIVKEIPIVLNSVDYSIEYEGEADKIATRMIIWTIKFTLKGYVYGAVTNAPIIRESIVNFLADYNIHDVGLVTFNLANTGGFGYYQTGEAVFQGFSLDTAIGTALVTHYSNVTNKLTVSNIYGDFKTNTIVIGTLSNAEHALKSFNIANNKLMSISVTISPNTASANDDFKYVVHVTNDF